MSVVRAIEQDFSANARAGNVSEVNLHLVHADAADDRRSPSFDQYLSRARKLPGKTIVIAKRHDSDFGAALCGESAVIAQRIAGSELLDAGNAAGNAHSQFQV